jgi:exoribonuclease-2
MVDLKAIAYRTMEEYGFIPRFPKKVLREVETLDPDIPPEDITDLRGLPWSSIDNPDSLDLDQLEYCEVSSGGGIAVKLAIADVDLYVPLGSLTDRHAAHNGTSVYTGVETFPLLPGRLSAGLSSLLPGQDRRAVVVEYTVLPDGTTQPGEIYRALVRNRAKLAYEEVGAWLEGTGPLPAAIGKSPELEEQLRLQGEAALRLNRHRMTRGALELETLEPRAVLEGELVRDLVVESKNRARSLIEELMVAANETMVASLEQAGLPAIQRVVRVPKYWDGIVETAARFGDTLPAIPDSKALAAFLIHRKEADPDRFPDLSVTIVKLMGPGEYLVVGPKEESAGHFGLAVTDYTHATAPNRRYADIVNQRMIKSVLSKDPSPYRPGELRDLAAWLTGRDKASQKVERFMRKASAAVLLEGRTGEVFGGFVTGVTVHGTFVRVISPPVEGKIVRGGEGLVVGQRLRVSLVGTDPYRGHIDFEALP